MLDNIRETEILPKGPEDEIIPTRIANIDTHIAFLKSQVEQLQVEISGNQTDRTALLARARELHITEDETYKIVEVPFYPKKHVDIEALKRLAPEKYALIVQNLTSKATDKLKEQMAKIQVSIAQTDVKAIISEKGLLAQIIPEPKEPAGYETSVVKK